MMATLNEGSIYRLNPASFSQSQSWQLAQAMAAAVRKTGMASSVAEYGIASPLVLTGPLALEHEALKTVLTPDRMAMVDVALAQQPAIHLWA
ncbi:MAG: hypothetical protein SFZ03_08820 [Candidatus Melainabacteria bacterium]|nr:hypothetical protein [Candidatus Melainabacteria bacterium]